VHGINRVSRGWLIHSEQRSAAAYALPLSPSLLLATAAATVVLAAAAVAVVAVALSAVCSCCSAAVMSEHVGRAVRSLAVQRVAIAASADAAAAGQRAEASY
jgi:hypothetical protein